MTADRTRLACAAAVAGLLAGCMPMEQAPLVYSSKNQIGVGVTAGTPESPGLDVNIGYKGLDTAVVPVAFAKHCDPRSGVTCPSTDYRLQTVLGLNRTKGLSETNARELDRVRRQLEDTDSELDRIRTQLDAKKAQLLAIRSSQTDATLVATLTSVDPATNAAIPLSDDQQKQLTDARARQVIAAGQTEAAVQTEIDDLNSSKSKTEALAAQFRKSEADLLAQRRQSTDDDKKDALSVYGSFGGDANGDAKGAGLTLGKVFSTGIAAQNVSQGIRNASKLGAAGECMVKAKLLIADSVDPNVLSNALLACKPPEHEPHDP